MTWAGVVAGFRGAGRWLNAEAGKALMVAIVAVAVLIGAVMIYGAGGSATEAKVNWRWLQQVANANRVKAERRAADMAAMAEKSAEAQQRAERERDAALERATALERDLAALGAADAIVISRDERRRLFK